MKQKNNPAQILEDKKDKLNWQNFNFLENMLVFSTMRTMPGRNATPESGVHFRITLDSQNKAICILFKIDRDHQKNDPLIRDQKVRRPDYMSLYIDSKSCICTIIEMKGISNDEVKRGIDQILQLKKFLQFEIFNHLPTKLKVDYINYLLPNDTDYITLLSNTTLTEINMEENEYMKEIIEELKLLNLIDRLAIKFSNTQISNYDN
ncbi:MAG: hypothetical protein ACK5VD_00005 [Aphanizomenon sp.]